MGIKVVVAKYNKEEDVLENVSLLNSKVVEFVLSGAKIERASQISAQDFPFLPYIKKVVDVDLDSEIVVIEIKKGKNIDYVVFVPTKTN